MSLERCPFCGGDQFENLDAAANGGAVCCIGCHAVGPDSMMLERKIGRDVPDGLFAWDWRHYRHAPPRLPDRKLESAMRETDPESTHALETDARAVTRVLLRAYGDHSPKVLERAGELVALAKSDGEAYRALVAKTPGANASG